MPTGEDARRLAEEWACRLQDVYPPELYQLHYLADGDAYRGSGHSGDAASWELGRRPIAEAIHRAGAFLDIGCANGLLMESMAAWAPVEPYGLDFAPQLVAAARRRLPHWADRIFLGDALTWEPPDRFDYVRTELVYVPEARRREYVARLVERFVAPDGRLLVCGYGGDEVLAPLREWGYQPVLEREWRSSSGNRVQLAAIGVPG
jgi:SAM-dependent methyltransferase